MVGMGPRLSREGVTQELMARAAELWGKERANEIRASLEVTAEQLWVVAQNLPDAEQEPAFFML